MIKLTESEQVNTDKAHCPNTLSRALLSKAPGMRIIKTGLAIFACLFVDYFRTPSSPTQTAIIALFCLGHNLKTTFRTSMNRIYGTIIAGVFAYVFLRLAFQVLSIDKSSIFYRFLVVFFTTVLMQIIVKLKRPGGTGIGAMTFLIICMSDSAGKEAIAPLSYTINAVANTLIGIGIALFVDWLPPLNKLGRKLYLVKKEINPTENPHSVFNLAEFDEQSHLSSLFKPEEDPQKSEKEKGQAESAKSGSEGSPEGASPEEADKTKSEEAGKRPGENEGSKNNELTVKTKTQAAKKSKKRRRKK